MERDQHIGDKYHQMTKYSPTRIWSGARPSRRPEPFKEYKHAEAVSVKVKLPEGSLWEALKNRRSERNFKSEPMTLESLARLVWAAQGATDKAGPVIQRTAPSAGALYPIETYLVVNRVKEVELGVYHYNINKTALELVKKGDFGKKLAEAALGQSMCARAAAVFCFTAVIDRCKWKYAQRAYRYIYMEVGHISENVYLAAQDLDIGCCAMGAFFDHEVNEILGVDEESETIIYLNAVGNVK